MKESLAQLHWPPLKGPKQQIVLPQKGRHGWHCGVQCGHHFSHSQLGDRQTHPQCYGTRDRSRGHCAGGFPASTEDMDGLFTDLRMRTANWWAGPRNAVRYLPRGLLQASCVIVSGFRAAPDSDTYPLSNLIRPRCAEGAKPGRGKPVLIMHIGFFACFHAISLERSRFSIIATFIFMLL